MLCLGLLCSVLRFLYISYIREPWGVIPFELIQGVTHSAVWAAACSYIAHNTPPELRVSAQGVLSFIHNGAGRACGTIFGGIFSTYYGRDSTFLFSLNPFIYELKNVFRIHRHNGRVEGLRIRLHLCSRRLLLGLFLPSRQRANSRFDSGRRSAPSCRRNGSFSASRSSG